MSNEAAAKMCACLMLCVGAITIGIGVIAKAMQSDGHHGFAYAIGILLLLIGVNAARSAPADS